MRGHSGFTADNAPGNDELVHLDTRLAGLGARINEVEGEIARLGSRVATLYREHSELVQERGALNQRRTTLAIALTRVTPKPEARPEPKPAPAPRPRPAPTPTPASREALAAVEEGRVEPAGDEASARSVQAVLLTLGGLLLGVAAITFTAVAWTTFGPAGRAAILGTVTLVALAVPWLLHRRGLTATAETISAVALLLVGLDGYAAHSLGLFGVDRLLPSPAFAGLVLLFTAWVSHGYRRLAPLRTPGFVALLAAQPVIPLLAWGFAASASGGGSGGSSSPGPLFAAVGLLAATVAAQDLVIVRRLPPVPPERRVLTWVFTGFLCAVAWLAALPSLLPARSVGVAVLGGVTLLAAAGVSVGAAGVLARSSAHSSAHSSARSSARSWAAGSAVVAVVLAVGVPSVLKFPDAHALPFAVLVAVLVFAVRTLPPGWRAGAAIGGWCAAGIVGGWSVLQVAVHPSGMFPALPLSLLCLTVASSALPRAFRHHAVVAGLALSVLALPPVPLVTVTAAVVFLASTLLTPDGYEAGARAAAAGALATVAVVFALGDASTTAAVLAVLVVGGVAVALTGPVLARGAPAAAPVRLAVAAAGVATAIAAAPGAAVATAIAVGVPGAVVRTVALAAMAVAVLIAAGFAAGTDAGGLSAGGAGAGGPVGRRGLPAVPIAVGAVLGAVTVLATGPVTGPADAVVGALPALAALVGLVAVAANRPGVFVAGAVAAGVAAFADIAANSAPGTGLAVAAALAAAVAVAGPTAKRLATPGGLRTWNSGSRAGSMLVAGFIGLVGIPLAGGTALAAAVVSVRPPWASDVSGWPDLAARLAVLGWQLPVALALVAVAGFAALRDRADRYIPLLVGFAAVVFAVPSALALAWWTPMALSGLACAGLALVASRLTGRRNIVATAGVAGVLGIHAAAVSLARPGGTAVVLDATVAVCVLVAVLTRSGRLRDTAVGGALAALPGAAAATAAALSVRPALVLSLGLATASLALGAASLIGLARRAELPAAGAVLGALICVGVALVVPTATGWDHLAAGLLLVGAASRLWRRRRESRGAGGATLAFVAEMSQLAALLIPGAPVLTTAAVVAVTALVVGRLPVDWRSGPLGGLAIAAGAVGLVAGAATVVDACVTVATLSPWGADLGRWLHPRPPGIDLLAWQPAAAMVVLAVAAVAVRRPANPEGDRVERAVPGFASVMVALAAVQAPTGLGLPWWTPAAAATTAAVGFGLLATRGTARLTAVLAGVLAVYAGAAALARPTATAVVLTALIAAGAAIALRGGTTAGGGAVFLAVAAVPAAAVSWLRALELPVAMPHVAVAGAALALVGAVSARQRFAPWARGGLAVAVTGTLAMPPDLPVTPSVLHAAAAALIGMAGAVLVRKTPQAAGVGWALWVVPVVAVGSRVLPPLGDALTAPYGTQPWSGERPVQGPVDWPAVLALALVTVGLAGLMWFGGRRKWLASVVIVPAAAAVLVAPVAWPGPVITASLVAVMYGIAAARVTTKAEIATALCCAVTVTSGGAALAGAAATRATTFATLGVAVVAGGIAGVIGRGAIARTTGWLVAAVSALILATLTAADLDAVPLAAGPFLVALLLLAAAAVLERKPESIALEGVSAVAALTALACAAGLRGIATVLVGYGAVLGLSAVRPGRTWFAPVAGAAELLAWWMLLFAADVGLIEAYTLPFALLALVGGIRGKRPALRSWVVYGPALAAAFLPSLALVLAEPGEPVRRLLLGAGAIAVVVVGGAKRWQAPVVVGAVVLVSVTLHELVVWWDELPRWIPLAVGGLLLVTVGATYERRRRDLTLIRTAVKEMR